MKRRVFGGRCGEGQRGGPLSSPVRQPSSTGAVRKVQGHLGLSGGGMLGGQGTRKAWQQRDFFNQISKT